MTDTTSQELTAGSLSASIGEILDAKQRAAAAEEERSVDTGEGPEPDGVVATLVSFVRAHPLQSLAVAIAVGAVATMLFRRR